MQTVSRLIDNFIPTHYDLSLTLEREKRTFSGVVTLNGSALQDKTITVHAKELTIETATVDGHATMFAMGDNDELTLTRDDLVHGEHIVVIGFSGTISDQMHGLYPCYFEHDGIKKELLATQFESHHAREVFPCIDEPEAKATFDVTLSTEKNIAVLGNMPVKVQREEADVLVTQFETSPRMSSYLLAFVVGEMHKKTATTAGGVEINVWSTPAQDAAGMDFALDIAVRATEFYNDYYGIDYPLPKCDHVALPDFSSGAMENWGLITYRESTLLAHPNDTSVSAKRYIAMVVCHELSHQWFGNLVTMKWWNNLWLNESFANLMEYIAIDALHPEWNIWLDFSSQESIMSLRRDALKGVQAVQVEVHHPDEISTLFDGAIVYAKGSRLLRMLQHHIGHEAFQAGLKTYFKKHAYQNTEGEDLWRELSQSSGQDISAFMNPWIMQSGFPVLHVNEDSLSQEQFFVGEKEASEKLWPIPLVPSATIDESILSDKQLSMTIPGSIRFNVGDSAHFLTHYSHDHLARILKDLSGSEPIDRLQLLHEQTMLARGGIINSTELIAMLATYKNEDIEAVWDIIGISIGELKKFVEHDTASEQALRGLSAAMAHTQYERLGWYQRDDEPETDTKLRSTILGMTLYGEDFEALERANIIFDSTEYNDIDPEIRGLIISSKVRHHETNELISSLLKTYASTTSTELKSDICAGLTSSKNPETVRKLLDAMKDTSVIRNQDVFRWFAYLMRGRDSKAIAWQWMKDNWQWIEETFGGDKSFDDFPRYAASGLSDTTLLQEYKDFFTPMLEIPALKRVVSIGITEISARIELIDRDGPTVRSALLDL